MIRDESDRRPIGALCHQHFGPGLVGRYLLGIVDVHT